LDTPDLPSHAEVAAEIVGLQLGVDAAELHGSLCGFVAAGGSAAREEWVRQLEFDSDAVRLVFDGALDRLFRASQAQLSDPDLGFMLLLPEEDAPVSERADALLGWCRGFLGGFGLVPGPRAELSPEASEALEDLGKIAASSLSYDDPDGDEVALVEVAEFVRVAALLLHSDCVDAPRQRRRLH
jgi:uncharacterized protein YgfB (UPF0149 family)